MTEVVNLFVKLVFCCLMFEVIRAQSTTTGAPCFDTESKTQCQFWKLQQHCISNSAKMIASCPLSCGFCTPSATTPTDGGSTTVPLSTNYYFNGSDCTACDVNSNCPSGSGIVLYQLDTNCRIRNNIANLPDPTSTKYFCTLAKICSLCLNENCPLDVPHYSTPAACDAACAPTGGSATTPQLLTTIPTPAASTLTELVQLPNGTIESITITAATTTTQDPAFVEWYVCYNGQCIPSIYSQRPDGYELYYSAEYCSSKTLCANVGSAHDYANCVDKYRLCPFWKTSGECEGHNSIWMFENCPGSCRQCSPIVKQYRGPCEDLNKNCLSWAIAGECLKRADYMNWMCPKICQTC